MNLGGYHVPEGTTVLTAQYSFHHNPDYWPDPDKFQLERCGHLASIARCTPLPQPYTADRQACTTGQAAAVLACYNAA